MILKYPGQPIHAECLLWSLIKIIHFAYPAFTFTFFLITCTITICTRQTRIFCPEKEGTSKRLALGLIVGVIFFYFAEAFVHTLRGIITGNYPDQDQIVYLIASGISFGTQGLVLLDKNLSICYPYYTTWIVGLIVEITLLVFGILDGFNYILLVGYIIRASSFIVLSLYHYPRNFQKKRDVSDVERQSLLKRRLTTESPDSGTSSHSSYGTNINNTSDNNESDGSFASEDSFLTQQKKDLEAIEKRIKQEGDLVRYTKAFAIFIPFLWPFYERNLQFRALIVILCLLASNALNVFVPRQMGVMIDCLTKYAQGDHYQNVWIPAIIYTVLCYLSGESGIGWLRRWLWIPIEQYSYEALCTASHSHILGLSSDFHDSKSSSELTQAVYGARSVTDLVETICFQLAPMCLDLTVALLYLCSQFGPYMGLILITTVILYLYTTTQLYARRIEKRRQYITMFRREWDIGQQSLDNWRIASLFNMITHEKSRYESAVKDHLNSKKLFELSTQLISASQALIMAIGLLGALSLGIYQVVYDGKSVGQFTTLLIYWSQLYSKFPSSIYAFVSDNSIGPLNFFSTMYRSVMNSLIDAERLLELFRIKPTIIDLPGAKPLEPGGGLVRFDHVSFSYDPRKPTLKDVSFIVPPGKTVALVGETGGGKSTILKLIDRFYDINSGSISIDGQDIRDVTISSIRGKIGVVPQDPVLFDDTIMNNVRYAKLSATDEEVHEACKTAFIHDKIMKFPDGYSSKVGDSGIKLSGGEKQRIAIARVLLKQPQIILLDEATSAIDTETEELIQRGLQSLCRDRTTFIVAHRLSTIMNADHILVVMNGEVIEEGTHEGLIQKNGNYKDLWSKQTCLRS